MTRQRYITVASRFADSLDEQVNTLLDQGWKLYKGPYGTTENTAGFLCQALTRNEPVKLPDFNELPGPIGVPSLQ